MMKEVHGAMFPCSVLLVQNTWVVCEEQKFSSHCSGGCKVQDQEMELLRALVLNHPMAECGKEK